MELKQENITKLQNVLNNGIDNEEKISYEELKVILTDVLTEDEKELFNAGKYCDIIPVLYALEVKDQTGVICIVETYYHNLVEVQDCGYASSDDQRLVDYRASLSRAFECLFDL